MSEADGLPSGAVIESGTDGAGGYFLRLADGSQVCWGTVAAAAQDISTASGGVGNSNDYLNVVGSVGQGSSIRNDSAGQSVQTAMVDNSGFSDTTGAPFVALMKKTAPRGGIGVTARWSRPIAA